MPTSSRIGPPAEGARAGVARGEEGVSLYTRACALVHARACACVRACVTAGRPRTHARGVRTLMRARARVSGRWFRSMRGAYTVLGCACACLRTCVRACEPERTGVRASVRVSCARCMRVCVCACARMLSPILHFLVISSAFLLPWQQAPQPQTLFVIWACQGSLPKYSAHRAYSNHSNS